MRRLVTGWLLLGLLWAAPVWAALPRVVALDWASAETAQALGVTPVGMAQLADYRIWSGDMPMPDMMRMMGMMRRSGGGVVDAGEIDQPPFLLNTRNRTLEKNGQRIKLTQVEYAIMKMFMENPGKALSREEILDLVWGHDYFGELKIVDVNIRRLRLKIEDNATNPTYITTIWGFGYKWGL